MHATEDRPDQGDHPAPVFSGAPPPRPWIAPLGFGVAGALAVAYTAWQDPNGSGVFPQCPTRVLFGVDCPGCGGLRAVHALTHGDLAGALGNNLLVTILVPLAVIVWGLWLLRSLGATVPTLSRPPRPVLTGFALVVLAFTVVRNIDGIAFFEYLHSDL